MSMRRIVLIALASMMLLSSTIHTSVLAAPQDNAPLDPTAPAEEDKSAEASSQPTEYSDDPAYNSLNRNEFFSNVCVDPSSGTTVQLSGKDNIEKVLNYFMGKGLTLQQASGFVGNMMQESGVDPRKIQGGAVADDNYEMQNGVGFGLIQWTFSDRQNPLKAKGEQMSTPNEKKSFRDIDVQLEHIWDELNAGYRHTLTALKGADNPVDAAIIVHGPPNPGYEASADSPEDVRTVRGGNAQKVYDQYKDAPPAGGLSTGGDGSTQGGDTSGKAVIAIDPGHNAVDVHTPEETTGADLYDYPNSPEVDDMWQVGEKVKAGLEEKGYKVEMLRSSKDESVDFKQRAERAKKAGAAMAISLHSTPGASEVFNQFTGAYRQGSNGKIEFKNDQTAQKSTQYSEAVAKKRAEAEGGPVPVSKVNFDGRPDIAAGNLAWVQMLSPDVPWVYNEFAKDGRGGSIGLTDEDKDTYAKGVIEGIVAANPSGGSPTTGGCGGSSGGAVSGDLAATAKAYAWPETHPSGFTERKKEYVDAIAKTKADSYIGGCEGVDCGAFVTRLVIDSGHDPGYNFSGKSADGAGPTSTQEDWAKKNWEPIGSGVQDPAKLKPGDVAINAQHTFIFVGDGVFEGTDIASASLCDRAPMAGGNSANEPGFNWYRKKV
ncbi:N-acetylmuramoyl-L-alanine amidase [Candidatus Saccharibacteria bacterium]|nr:N-acetylmuramoyl-L-alanine amidase [Candidatus Saccharibacteria bacterium]